MKYFAAVLLATTAFAQFDPTNCCNELPIDGRCIGCYGEPISMNHHDVDNLVSGVIKGADIETEDTESIKNCKYNSHPFITDMNTIA